jgi:hypothetical protein
VRNDVAHASPGIANIAVVSWDEMDVKVKNRLACGCATVDTYIVSIGLVILLNGGLGLINGAYEGNVFFRRGLEPRRNVSSRNQERMAGRHRVSVPQTKHLIPAQKYASLWWVAERTFHGAKWYLSPIWPGRSPFLPDPILLAHRLYQSE